MKEDIILFTAAVAVVAVAFIAASYIGDTEGYDSSERALPEHLSSPLFKPFAPDNTGPNPELSRCLALGEAALRDTNCLQSWKDNRQRFLGGAKANNDSQSPSPNAPQLLP